MSADQDQFKFRNAMDSASLRARLNVPTPDAAYALAVAAAGHQSAFTVDHLARKLRDSLPFLIEQLAAQVEREEPIKYRQRTSDAKKLTRAEIAGLAPKRAVVKFEIICTDPTPHPDGSWASPFCANCGQPLWRVSSSWEHARTT